MSENRVLSIVLACERGSDREQHRTAARHSKPMKRNSAVPNVPGCTSAAILRLPGKKLAVAHLTSLTDYVT